MSSVVLAGRAVVAVVGEMVVGEDSSLGVSLGSRR